MCRHGDGKRRYDEWLFGDENEAGILPFYLVRYYLSKTHFPRRMPYLLSYYEASLMLSRERLFHIRLDADVSGDVMMRECLIFITLPCENCRSYIRARS